MRQFRCQGDGLGFTVVEIGFQASYQGFQPQRSDLEPSLASGGTHFGGAGPCACLRYFVPNCRRHQHIRVKLPQQPGQSGSTEAIRTEASLMTVGISHVVSEVCLRIMHSDAASSQNVVELPTIQAG